MDAVSGDTPIDIPQELREAIGKSSGRITLDQQLKRIGVLFKSIPDHIWPSTGELMSDLDGKSAAIVGGGPSLEATFPSLQAFKKSGGIVFAPNKSHDWLINGKRSTDRKNRWVRKPLIPNYGVLVDPSPHIETYMTPHQDVSYLLGAILDYHCYLKFLRANSKVYTWIPTYNEDASDIMMCAEKWPKRPMQFISGGSTVGLRTIGLAVSMGVEDIHLYGFDSAYAPKTKDLYAYKKPFITTEYSNPTIVAEDDSQLRFESNHHMAKQAMEFNDFCDRLDYMIINGKPRNVTVTVHGDGPIPWMAWKNPSENIRHADPDAMSAKYGEHKYFDYATGLGHVHPLSAGGGDTPVKLSGDLPDADKYELPAFSEAVS